MGSGELLVLSAEKEEIGVMNTDTGRKVEKFEDLIAWQKARGLTLKIYQVSRNGEFRRDYRLSGQIQGAAVSIMSNIAEGFERGGLGEFHQSLSTAKASCAEVRSQLSELQSRG